jgi:hypothetical protein
VKRGLIFCLLICVIFTMVAIPVNAAEQMAKIEIQTPSVLPKAGEEFEVVATIRDNPGIRGIQFDLFAETETIECKEIKLGEMFEGAIGGVNPKTSGGARIGVASIGVIEEDGVIATYTFIANEAITAFDFKVKNVEFINEEREKLPYTIIGAAEVFPEEPSDAEVKEEEPPVTEHLYADTEGHWSERYINTATEKGLFKGDEKGFFNPDGDVTRAQFVTVLWRMAGSPAADAENVPFADIKEQSDEFKIAIAWGYANDYINGTSKNTFEPDGNLTREAAVKILHAYSGGQSGMELVFAFVYDGHFKDSNQISDWARPSVYWGIYYKMLSGTSADTLSPQDTVTRAQLAKILVNYITTYTN